MQSIISETDGFKTILKLTPVSSPRGHVELQFITEWDNARRDGSEQVQYRLTLSADQLHNLKELLHSHASTI
jgi:hypothetical protein